MLYFISCGLLVIFVYWFLKSTIKNAIEEALHDAGLSNHDLEESIKNAVRGGNDLLDGEPPDVD